MTITIELEPNSPFAPARERARVKKAAEDERARKAKEAKEAADLLKQQQKAEEALAAEAAEALVAEQRAEQAREAAKQQAMERRKSPAVLAKLKQSYSSQDIASFKTTFLHAVGALALRRGLKDAGIDVVEAYATALVSDEETVEIPRIEHNMAGFIHDEFNDTMDKLVRRRGHNNIPARHFVGQRQDWYTGKRAVKKRR